MIHGCIERGCGPLRWTLCQTQKITHMGPMTCGPCPIKVSEVVVSVIGMWELCLGFGESQW